MRNSYFCLSRVSQDHTMSERLWAPCVFAGPRQKPTTIRTSRNLMPASIPAKRLKKPPIESAAAFVRRDRSRAASEPRPPRGEILKLGPLSASLRPGPPRQRVELARLLQFQPFRLGVFKARAAFTMRRQAAPRISKQCANSRDQGPTVFGCSRLMMPRPSRCDSLPFVKSTIARSSAVEHSVV